MRVTLLLLDCYLDCYIVLCGFDNVEGKLLHKVMLCTEQKCFFQSED